MKTAGITKIKTKTLSADAAGNVYFGGYLGASNNALYRSTDSGNNWSIIQSGNEHYYRVVQHFSDTLWSCQGFEHPSVFAWSANNGASWTTDTSVHPGQAYDIAWRPGGTVFAGTETGQLCRSLDYGRTWTQDIANAGSTWANVLAVEIDRYGNIFAGTTGSGTNLNFSTAASNGNAWSAFSNFPAYTPVRDIVFDSANNAFIATNNGIVRGAYSSSWSGSSTTWTSLTSGLPPPPSFCFNVGFDKRGYLYASLVDGLGGGLYRSTIPVNTVSLSVPLPVGCESFTGFVKGTDVSLQWRLAGSGDVSHYEVQRAPDGSHFEQIAAIPAHEGAGEYLYSYADRELSDGDYLYRLATLNKDGSTQYVCSTLRLVIPSVDVMKMSIAPNPVVGDLNIRLSRVPDAATTFRIINVKGQVLYQSKELRTQQLQLNTDFLAPGFYYLELSSSKQRLMQSLIKHAH
jgi:hypothetical protein